MEIRAQEKIGHEEIYSISLEESVKRNVNSYLEKMRGKGVTDFYGAVFHEVEKPLLKEVMNYFNQNQCKTAKYLGISRGTLRKKLAKHGMLYSSRTVHESINREVA